MNKIFCASVVTKKSFKEFLILKETLEIFHNAVWYLSTDDYALTNLKSYQNCFCESLIMSDDGTHGVHDPVKNDNHVKMMMTKFNACNRALENHDFVLFLDSDMIFVNEIDSAIIDLINNNSIDAILSPHHTENKNLESQVGYFNGGMFVIRNKNFLNEWMQLSTRYKEFGLYYEQQPVEIIAKNYVIANFPIQYNIGWWRMNEKNTEKRIEALGIGLPTQDIFFLGKKAVNFHVHTLKDLEYENYGTFLLNKLFICLARSNNLTNKKVLDKIIGVAKE